MPDRYVFAVHAEPFAAVARARTVTHTSFRHGDGLARGARAGQCRRRHDRDEPP
jgi:hypothetical protein